MKNSLSVLLMIAILIFGSFQILQFYRFIYAGARFTAADGQELCLRVARLENPPGECHYLEDKK